MGLDSDGSTVIAFNLDYSDLVADADSGRVTAARRDTSLQIADVAIHGSTAAVLGFPVHLRTADFAQLWVGKAGAPWTTFRAVHPIGEAAEEIVRYAIAPAGGAVTFAHDGTIAMISPAEPGVFRYRVDGTPLPTLGTELHELEVPRMREATFGYRFDVEGRYREIFDRQAMINDLIDTPDGLAIVVRVWAAGQIGWELWFPDQRKVRRRIVLGMSDRAVAGGDLKCSSQGASIACIFDRKLEPKQPPRSQLALFDLRRVTRSGTCQ